MTDCRIIGPKGFVVAKDDWIGVHASGVYEQVLLRTVESELFQHGEEPTVHIVVASLERQLSGALSTCRRGAVLRWCLAHTCWSNGKPYARSGRESRSLTSLEELPRWETTGWEVARRGRPDLSPLRASAVPSPPCCHVLGGRRWG